MTEAMKRNPLTPWYIGLVIIAAVDFWVAGQLFSSACEAPGIVAMGVVTIIPAVYLILMYLTFKSQR